MTEPLLAVDGLQVYFPTRAGVIRAVDGVSFTVAPGEALGIVGESGSGKSVTALSMLKLIDRRARVRLAGSARLDGVDLLKLSDGQLQSIRGNKVGMVFQDPLTSLNPVMPVGEQIGEVLRCHRKISKDAARQRSVELLERVGISAARLRLDQFPHEFSGGMRQRIMIAIAIACEPRLLIADEPTTALDVTIQAQILNLLADLRQQMDMALLLISHDLGVVGAVCDRVQVMYAGRLAEAGAVHDILQQPQHPYTRGLMRSSPRLDRPHNNRLNPIPGLPMIPLGAPRGCAFAPRCTESLDRCSYDEPPAFEVGPGHEAACWQVETMAREPELIHAG